MLRTFCMLATSGAAIVLVATGGQLGPLALEVPDLPTPLLAFGGVTALIALTLQRI